MEKKVKISVIVPIYNVEKYLDRGIRSILNQTFKNFELILVNDGSTDNSLSICDKYKRNDKRVKLINKDNEGVSASRNLGIKISTGEFIMFVDPDDELEEDAIEYLYSLIQSYNADIACYKMKTYKNNILNSNINIDEEIRVYYAEEIIREQANKGVFLHSSCNKLYSKSVVNDTRFNENIRYAEDALFNFNILSDSNVVVMSNLQKYNYYINQTSTVSKFNEKRIDVLKAQCEIYELLENRYNKYMDNVTRDIICSTISIIIDMVVANQFNKDILLKLKHIIKDNNNKLKDRSLVGIKEKIIFNILYISPKFTWSLYNVRFRIRRYIKNRG